MHYRGQKVRETDTIVEIYRIFVAQEVTRLMKQVIFTIFMTITAIVLLLSSVLPHHHHGDRVCYALESCELDHSFNDGHTHHHDNNDEHHEGSCIADFKYIVGESHNDTKCGISDFSDFNPDQTFYLPLLYLVAEINNLTSSDTISGGFFRRHLLEYKSPDYSQFHGLRAPPSFFS